jgi:hypothetical protein
MNAHAVFIVRTINAAYYAVKIVYF